MKLPLFPTQVIGSLPRTQSVRALLFAGLEGRMKRAEFDKKFTDFKRSLDELITSNFPGALKVKVTNLRPGPKHSWCAGCAFVEPLTGDQLNVILQNSR